MSIRIATVLCLMIAVLALTATAGYAWHRPILSFVGVPVRCPVVVPYPTVPAYPQYPTYPPCPGWSASDPCVCHVIATYQRYLGRRPTNSELRHGVAIMRTGGQRAFDRYFRHVVLPHHAGHYGAPGLSRDECMDFDFAGQAPSAELKMRIDRTSKENLKVLLQRCIFVLTYDPDPMARGTATWVREQIYQIVPPGSQPPVPPTIPPPAR